jgi:hypothetical protein
MYAAPRSWVHRVDILAGQTLFGEELRGQIRTVHLQALRAVAVLGQAEVVQDRRAEQQLDRHLATELDALGAAYSLANRKLRTLWLATAGLASLTA